MDRLIEINRAQIAAGLPAPIRAAWLHHAFTQIHPFPDGNGRVARALASLVLIQGGGFPFVVWATEGARYRAALQVAESGDPEPFIRFTLARQKRECLRVGAIPRPLQQSSLDSALAALERKLTPSDPDSAGMHALYSQASEIAKKEMQALQEKLTMMFRRHTEFNVVSGDSQARIWLERVPREMLWYRVDFGRIDSSVLLHLSLRETYRIVISFTATSSPFNGIVTAHAQLFDGANVLIHYNPEDIFAIYYTEPAAAFQDRFSKWMETQLTAMLAVINERL